MKFYDKFSLVPAAAAAVGLLLFLAILLAQTSRFRASFEAAAERDIAEKTDLAAALLEPVLARGDATALAAFCAARHAEGIRVSVIDPSGRVLADSAAAAPALGDHSRREEFISARAGRPLTVVRRSSTLNELMLYRARPVGGYVLRLAVSYEGAMAPVRLARRGLATAGLVGALVVVLIFLLTRHLQSRLAVTANERDEKTRILDDARRAESFRRDFVANVSHEIKTPLTGILGAVEALEEPESLTPAERASLFAVLRKQSTRLNSLVQDILSLAQLEREQADPGKDFVPCALDAAVSSAVSLARHKAAAAGIALSLVRNDEVTREGDAQLLEQAVSNLVDNAIKYSGSKAIEVSLVKEPSRAIVEVRDHGVGIAPEHQARVFERFYRVDKARSRALGGTGLGLAIVKHVAQLHGGEATLSSVPGQGCAFRLLLPLP